jgi:hypothetical protein
MKRSLINFAAFQTCWFASVLGAAAGVPLLGPAFAAVWLPLHIRAAKSSAGLELKLILAAGALGYLLDSALVLGGWISFPAQAQLGVPSTLWMVTLWLGFAATLRHSLGWLRGRYVVSALLGIVVGPLAYWGGSKLGAIVLVDSVSSLLPISVEWLIAMPLLLMTISYLEHSRATRTGDDASHSTRQESL